MKTLIAILLSTLATSACEQTQAQCSPNGGYFCGSSNLQWCADEAKKCGFVQSSILSIYGTNQPDPPQKPLTCPPYQHVFHWVGSCGPSPCDENGGCYAVCYPPPPDRCVDDTHTVTEAEWQALMKRVAEVENPIKMAAKRNEIIRACLNSGAKDEACYLNEAENKCHCYKQPKAKP